MYNDSREILNAFMDSGANPDGREGEEGYIDCYLKDSTHNLKGVCGGILAKSTNDSTGLAQVKLRLRGGNSKVTHSLSIGIIHPLNIARLYPSDANGVVLYYK